MRCKSSTKQWVKGFKQCVRCGCSWGKSYGKNPPCFYKKPDGWKIVEEFNIDGFPVKERSESHLEFSHDIKLDKRLIV
jgi:hypothetical protein